MAESDVQCEAFLERIEEILKPYEGEQAALFFLGLSAAQAGVLDCFVEAGSEL